jgi:hypothetical protein
MRKARISIARCVRYFSALMKRNSPQQRRRRKRVIALLFV